MALAWAAPGSSLQGNTGLANAVAGGLDWMTTHVYTTNATEYDNWFHWEISGPQALNNTAVLLLSRADGRAKSPIIITRWIVSGPGGPGATFGWMTGANTSDKVLVVGIRGILAKNAAKIAAGTRPT